MFTGTRQQYSCWLGSLLLSSRHIMNQPSLIPRPPPTVCIIVNTQWSGNKARTNLYTWAYHPITCCDGSSFFYSSTGPLLHAVSSTHVPDSEHDVRQQTCSGGWPCWIRRWYCCHSFLSYNVSKLAVYSFMHLLCQQVQSYLNSLLCNIIAIKYCM